ncbi:carboxylesterase 5A-like [Mytilus galloprovincialis]|uniref:carboxylesterase 5A-like n=1 Tax=Mytilus galloprovincialis TaxID=29158 RepID=UPI003F7C3289
MVLFWLSISLLTVFSSAYDTVTVRTNLGEVLGLRRTVLGKDLYEFRKIPYARPPVGNLRFEKPQPYGSWESILDARMFGPSCFQNKDYFGKRLMNKNISEDCLFLNIYVPSNVSTDNQKSVIVWIHGGSYASGKGSIYDGARLAVTGDVIIVTINYRLNIFGFLSLDDLPGNYGLWDQIMAIQWVKDNIPSFGGNSKSITISGESAGGFSVALLSIAPINKGLFQRAIMQSGTALSTYAVGKFTKLASFEAASYVNCTDNHDDVLAQCLKEVPAHALYTAFRRRQRRTYLQIAFAPVVDGELLLDEPLNLMTNYSSDASMFFRSLDVLIGTVSGESSLLILILKRLETRLGFNLTDGIPKQILTNNIAPEISKIFFNSSLHVSAAISRRYSQSRDYMEQTNEILNVYSDFSFDVLSLQSLQLHSPDGQDHGSQFHYFFSRESPYPLFGELPAWFNRSEHGAEVIFMFTNKLTNITEENKPLSEILMKYWTNFAKSGNVNGPDLPHWKEFDKEKGHFINLDTNITSGQHLHGNRMNFWLDDIPILLQDGTSAALNIDYKYSVFINLFYVMFTFMG